MKLTFLGAAGGHVTGSMHLLETSKARILVDCGAFQGEGNGGPLNTLPPQLHPETLDAVVLTHAHLDHTGRLPLLARAGWTGTVWATPATIELVELLLRDACRLHLQDVARQERRIASGRQGTGVTPMPPSSADWDERDVDAILQCMKAAPYDKPFEVAPGISVTMKDAGHMLGSTHFRVRVEDGGVMRHVSFSGDLGPCNVPIMRDPEPFFGADDDLVLLESTYGDRDHRSFTETVAQFKQVLLEAVRTKAKVLVPSFAVGRSQLLIHLLDKMFKSGEVPEMPVYLDSPMAIRATQIYCHHPELLDEAAVAAGSVCAIGKVDWLKPTATADESRRINDARGPLVVVAGAGMCTGGRILHHLRHGLGDANTHVVIAGYQAKGGAGRLLVEGRKQVNILGDEIDVKAQIHTLGGFSAHAGRSGLLTWMAGVKKMEKKPRVVLVHGEDGPRKALADGLFEKYGIHAHMPQMGEVVEL